MSAGNQSVETEKQPLNIQNVPKYAIKPVDVNTTKFKVPLGATTKKKAKLSLFNKLSLTYINVINYNQRRALYPFATFFSTYYSMTAPRFAWIISAFHLGGFLAIFISPYMMHLRFNLFLVTMLIILAITNLLMDIWYSFVGLLILRIISGIVCTITWSEVTGAIGAFTEEGAERTTGIIITESSFTITTLFYVVIGIILNDLNVTWFWVIMSAMGIFGAILAFLLPNISLHEAAQGNEPKLKRILSYSTLSLVPTTPYADIDDDDDDDDYDDFNDIDMDKMSDVDEERENDENNENISVNADRSFPELPSTKDVNKKQIKEKDDKFSLKTCLKAYGAVSHLMVHFFLLFCMSTQFSAFSVTFGEWLVVTYSLNAAELGYFTIANTLGGVTALIIAPILSKYRPNIFGIIVGSTGVASMTFIISILVWTGTNKYILILIFFYLYWIASQVMFLNIIVCNLDFSPKGYESTSSLIFQMIARAASFIGTVIGPNVVNLVSFPFLINLSCLLFIIATILYIAMYRYLHRKKGYEKLTKIKAKKETP